MVKSILDSNFKEFSNLTADKSKLINVTDLITDAAKRSLVDVQEFSPIEKENYHLAKLAKEMRIAARIYGIQSNNGFDNSQNQIDPIHLLLILMKR